MTRTQRILGLSGICLLIGSFAGCYFNRESPDDYYVEGSRDDFDGDGWEAGADCDDGNASVYPGAEEICGDGIDNDCDKELDFEDAECQVGGDGGNSQGGSGGTGGTGQGGAGGTGGMGQGGTGLSIGGMDGVGGSSQGGAGGTGGTAQGGAGGSSQGGAGGTGQGGAGGA
jgi:hypothetical protein